MYLLGFEQNGEDIIIRLKDYEGNFTEIMIPRAETETGKSLWNKDPSQVEPCGLNLVFGGHYL